MSAYKFNDVLRWSIGDGRETISIQWLLRIVDNRANLNECVNIKALMKQYRNLQSRNISFGGVSPDDARIKNVGFRASRCFVQGDIAHMQVAMYYRSFAYWHFSIALT